MTEDQELVEELLKSLSKNDKLSRKHASFWNFYKKASKELGLFSEIFDRFKEDFSENIVEWGLCDFDPPDIYVKLSDGSVKGVEITELVNEKAIKAQISGDPEYHEELFRFDNEAAILKLRNILAEKEKKLSNRFCDYSGLSLLIHTDEFLLKSEQFIDKGNEIFPNGSDVFERVYLLFSYEPDKQHSPLVRLV